MVEPQIVHLDVHQMECIIAAILSTAPADVDTESLLTRYSEIYCRLQAVGSLVVEKPQMDLLRLTLNKSPISVG